MLENTIIHGGCLEVMVLIPDKSIDMILTDIPYNEVSRLSNGLRNLNKGNADILGFDLYGFLKECVRILKGSIYIFCGIEQVSFIRKTLVECKMSTRHCVWEKTNPSPMNGQHIWLSSIENCIFAKKKNAVFYEHCKGCVWRFPTVRSKLHPTEKPQGLLKYLINTSSNPGDIVFDPCAGSGSTGLAANALGRGFILIEKENEYCEVISKRLNRPYIQKEDYVQ